MSLNGGREKDTSKNTEQDSPILSSSKYLILEYHRWRWWGQRDGWYWQSLIHHYQEEISSFRAWKINIGYKDGLVIREIIK
jgi:hypothetical protein